MVYHTGSEGPRSLATAATLRRRVALCRYQNSQSLPRILLRRPWWLVYTLMSPHNYLAPKVSFPCYGTHIDQVLETLRMEQLSIK